VLEAVFILLEFPSPSRRILIGSHSLPPSLVRLIGPSISHKFFHEIADVLVLLRNWCLSEDRLCQEMGKRMLVKYYKYFGEKYGEKRSDREERGEKDKGDQLLNIIIFFCVAIDPRYKLSNYIKMSTMVMFGAEIGGKLWATVNSSFRDLFE
jgi:hypothetical protein